MSANSFDPTSLKNVILNTVPNPTAPEAVVNPSTPLPTSKPDDFVKQEAKAPKQPKQKTAKEFNPWKWVVIAEVATPILAVTGAVVGAGMWFMHTPSTLSKTLKPADIQAMLDKYARGEEVKIPKGVSFPLLQSKLGFSTAIDMVRVLRYLPQDNKWEVFKYLMSPKGLKSLPSLPGIVINLLFQNDAGLAKQDLSILGELMSRGGTVTKKLGQQFADAKKQKVLASHRAVVNTKHELKLLESNATNYIKENPSKFVDRQGNPLNPNSQEALNKLEELKKQLHKELKEATNQYEASKKLFEAFASLQSKEVHWTKKEKAHFQRLYEVEVGNHNRDYPHRPLTKKPLSSLKIVEASTAAVVLQDGFALKLLKQDARPENAVKNLEFYLAANSLFHPTKVMGRELEGEDLKEVQEAIFKSSIEQSGAILQGSNFHNEKLGLELMRQQQQALGITEGLAPKPYGVHTIKGVDGHDYQVIVMEQIKGVGDLSKLVINALNSPNPFDLNSKEWQLYRETMSEEIPYTIAMQSLGFKSTDGHGGNFLLKTQAEKEAIKASKLKNGGLVPIDLAEHVYIHPNDMKKIAKLFFACINAASQHDQPARDKARETSMAILNSMIRNKAGDEPIHPFAKRSILTKIESAPLRILDVLFEVHKEDPFVSERLYFPDSPTLHRNNVLRSYSKFAPVLGDAQDHKGRLMLDQDKEGLKRYEENQREAVAMVIEQMERYAGGGASQIGTIPVTGTPQQEAWGNLKGWGNNIRRFRRRGRNPDEEDEVEIGLRSIGRKKQIDYVAERFFATGEYGFSLDQEITQTEERLKRLKEYQKRGG